MKAEKRIGYRSKLYETRCVCPGMAWAACLQGGRASLDLTYTVRRRRRAHTLTVRRRGRKGLRGPYFCSLHSSHPSLSLPPNESCQISSFPLSLRTANGEGEGGVNKRSLLLRSERGRGGIQQVMPNRSAPFWKSRQDWCIPS